MRAPSSNQPSSPDNRQGTTPTAHLSIPARDTHQPANATAPLGTLSYSHKHTSSQTLTIAVGAEYAKVRFRKPEAPGERHWTRGSVQAFSVRSRSRLLQSFAKTDFRGYEGRALFVTLTYHHEWSEVGSGWKEDLREWERRIRRRYAHAFMYWRLELQRRGAPHFHCLVFGLDESAKPLLKQTWLDVAEACCQWCRLYMARVDKLASWEQVGRYCSKYCAKVEEMQPEHPGRYWGIMNRAERTERLQTIEVDEGEAFRLRRVFKRLIRAANGYHKPGGPRSGVWVRCSNETAKRALEWASSAQTSPTQGVSESGLSPGDGHGRRPFGNEWCSRYGLIAASRTTTAHNTSISTSSLFDRADMDARRARRLLA